MPELAEPETRETPELADDSDRFCHLLDPEGRALCFANVAGRRRHPVLQRVWSAALRDLRRDLRAALPRRDVRVTHLLPATLRYRLPYYKGIGTATGHSGALGTPGCRPETFRERLRRVVWNAQRFA